MILDNYLKENYKFCPRCGAKFSNKKDHLYCQSCSFKFYYNPATAVCLLTRNKKGEILLAKRAIDPYKGYWDTVGGFLNPGESFEDAAVREFKEETGLDAKVSKYWGSTPDVYGDGGIQVANSFFEMEIIGGKMEAHDDVAELKYFAPNDIPEDISFKCSREFINLFKKENYD